MDATQHRSPRQLRKFTGSGYNKGAPAWKRALWVAFGQPVQASLTCPLRLRCTILRAFGASIDSGVIIRHHVTVHWPWKLSVGADSWIGVGVWLLNLEPITVGSNVCVSQQAMLCTGSHRWDDPQFEFDNGPVTVEDGAWIAARAIILRGVTISRDAVVSAGAVVEKDVPPGARVLSPQSTLT